MMVLETEQGPIQVPLDIQAASKAADEKCKRNATASHRFRQRRKEEQETLNNISKLEAQVREMTEAKIYYQQERDFLPDVVLQNCIPIPPRSLSPWRRRHALLGGPQTPDTEASAQNGGRNTRGVVAAHSAGTVLGDILAVMARWRFADGRSRMAVIYEQQSWEGEIINERDMKQGHGRPHKQHLVPREPS